MYIKLVNLKLLNYMYMDVAMSLYTNSSEIQWNLAVNNGHVPLGQVLLSIIRRCLLYRGSHVGEEVSWC